MLKTKHKCQQFFIFFGLGKHIRMILKKSSLSTETDEQNPHP